MQRIRIGLTGLAVVFLFVLLGAALLQSGGDDHAEPTAEENLSAPNEPLAELGVAPGQDEDANLTNTNGNLAQ